ncbi:MAG: hemolysin family protein, partial [Anaerolineae bacterium]
VDAGQEGGVLEEDEKEMIYSVFEIGDTLAREVMVPRIDMVAVEADTPLLEAADVAITHGHSRIPVYEETIDHIAGILYAKDLLKVLRQQGRSGGMRLADLARPAYFVPETKKVDVLLKELQQRRVHMAIVIDEYGGTAGLVTIEDILEEIVGEIRDEYDESEEPTIKRLGGGEYEIDARAQIDDVNDLLQVKLSDEESDTLGGFIYNVLGKVPAPGDEIEVEGVRLKVLDVQDRRIGKIHVHQLVSPSPLPETRNGSSEQA